MPVFIDLLGWTGAAALLSAYWMVSTRRTDGAAMLYQALNLIGSGLVLIEFAVLRCASVRGGQRRLDRNWRLRHDVG